MNLDQFEALLAAYLDGSLTPEGAEELAGLVEGSAELRGKFLAAVEMEGALRGHFVTDDMRISLILRTMICLPEPQKRKKTVELVMKRISTWHEVHPAPPQRHRPPKPAVKHSGFMVGWRIAAILAVMTALTIALIVSQTRGEDTAKNPPEKREAPAPTPDKTPDPTPDSSGFAGPSRPQAPALMDIVR